MANEPLLFHLKLDAATLITNADTKARILVVPKKYCLPVQSFITNLLDDVKREDPQPLLVRT